MFDVIALAIIFVSIVCIWLDVFNMQGNNNVGMKEFTKSLSVSNVEAQLGEPLWLAVEEWGKQFAVTKENTLDSDTPNESLENQDKENMQSTGQVHMTIAGDVLFSTSPLNKYDTTGKVTSILSQDLLQLMNTADITMVNLEFPFSLRGTKMEDKQYTFRADPARVTILNEMGIDVVSLANNHTLDFGTEALLDTIATLDNAQILSVGAGADLEQAKSPATMNVNGKSIAFLGASRVIPVTEWNATKYSPGVFTTYDPTALIEEIKLAKQTNDFVVVYVHWGIEKKEYPEEYQREMAKQYIDAGADIVIGSHPHVLQGIEYYNGKAIVYSLGNYIFGHTIDRTYLLDVQIDADNTYQLRVVPCTTQNAYTHTIEDAKALEDFYRYYEGISYGITIDSKGNVIKY